MKRRARVLVSLPVLIAAITGAGAETSRSAACQLLPASAGARLAQCRGTVHSRLPAFVFTLKGRRIGSDQRIVTSVEILRADRPKTPLQTLARPGWDIEVPGPGGKGEREEKGAIVFHELADLPLRLADINFDGYADIRLYMHAPRGCTFNHYWLFDPGKARFGRKRDEADLAIGGLQCGTVRLDAKRKVVTVRRQGMRYHMVTIQTDYRWRGTKLLPANARVEIIAKSGRCRARLYRYVSGKPQGTGYRDCPRDADGGNQYSPAERDLAKPGTYDKWLK